MGAVEFVSIALPAVFWPLVVGLIAWWQRHAIGRLIDRIRGGRVLGAEFDAPPRDLAEAVEGGVSSPEVEKVIRAASEAAEETPTFREESPVGKLPQPTPNSVAEASRATRLEFFERLTAAQRNDEDRRRAEIERVIQSAARWGAQLARNRPDEVDDFEPLVQWNDNGEPEIVVIQPKTSPSLEMRAAARIHAMLVEDHSAARREADTARKAIHQVAEPSSELLERVRNAEAREIQCREAMERSARNLAFRRRIHRHST
jgi:hypothetical protein